MSSAPRILARYRARVAFLFPLIAAALLSLAPMAQAQQALPDHVTQRFGTPPAIPSGPLPGPLRKAVKTVFIDALSEQRWGPEQTEALELIADSGDARIAWLITDLMRFVTSAPLNDALSVSAAELLQIAPPRQNAWGELTDHLIAWDIPAPPNYLRAKRAIYTNFLPGWDKLFVKGDVDWRLVSWGGVPIDNRPFGTTDDPCNCIPAADNPAVSSAAQATWLKDSDIVFGITINGQSRAYPRRIMEVREMVNDTLGGRDLGIPYCTLCGAAQAFYTDQLPRGVQRPVLRTSGLLSRSNKVMYDLTSYSVFDTFLGTALTGPLAKKGITLEQASVVTTTWGDWKAAHPDTTVLVEELALGRDFDFRNTRDANGPIFPVGDVDPRLPVQEDVIGVITASGKPVAFQRSKALLVLRRGGSVGVENVRLTLDAGGIRAIDQSGRDLGSHQAFWFAWSQFYPGTALWQG